MLPLLLAATLHCPVPVVLLMGQSNGVGYGVTADAGAEPDGWLYENGVDTWDSINQGAAFGPEWGIAKNAGRILDISKYTQGSTSLATNWCAGCGVYNAAIAATDTSLALIRSYEIIAWVFVQGEQDAYKDYEAWANAYESNLTTLVAAVRTKYGATLPVIIAQLGDIDATSYPFQGTVRAAQQAVCAADSNTTCIDTSGLTLNGIVHYDTDGQLGLGQRIAAAL